MLHTLSVTVDNKPGVLTRVTGLIARRGYNIESLAVDITEDPTISRVTIVVEGDDTTIEQITKQLYKLINVHKIVDLTDTDSVTRQLALFKINAPAERRHEIIEIASVFRANVVDVAHNSVTIEVTGDDDKIDGMEELLRAFGIKEVARTGKIALQRGSKN
ncbi:MAG: acetolactate synthase small subunit [Coriobacteriales bacterium]